MSDANTAPPVTTEAAPAAATEQQPAPTEAQAPPAATEESSATEAKPNEWDERFAALAKQSAEIRREKAAIKAQAEAVEKFARLQELSKKDRRAAIREMGISEDDLLLEIVGADAAPKVDPVAEVKAEVERLRQEREAEKVARQKAETDAWFAEFHRTTADKVRAAGDTYEALNALGRQGEVAAIIEGFFAETGQMLPFNEAAELAEAKALEFARQAISIKKLGGRPVNTPTVPANGQNKATLTNGMASAPKAPQQTSQVLTREESLRRAVELVESGQSPWLSAELAEA